ncbi:azurin [Shewanella sp. OPT22]|nr:azurin [Shewanella sp. OPT22]
MKIKTFLGLSLFALSSNAFAENCQIDVSVMDAMTYDKTSMEISLAKCDKVTVNLKHTGKMPKTAMGHNWVLTSTADQVAAAADGVQAGAENNYLKTGDSRVLAFTKLIGGGESVSVTFDTKALKAGGDYTYFCSFPGHSFLMKGKFAVKA